MASFEFIRINTIRNAANNVAYAMARQAMVSGADATNIEANNQGILQALGVRNHTITFTPAVIAADTDRVTVEIRIPLADNGWIAPASQATGIWSPDQLCLRNAIATISALSAVF